MYGQANQLQLFSYVQPAPASPTPYSQEILTPLVIAVLFMPEQLHLLVYEREISALMMVLTWGPVRVES